MRILTFIEKRPTSYGNPKVVVCRFSDNDNEKAARKLEALIIAAPDLLDALKRDEQLANAAILATPTGDYRNKLTELNILRLQDIIAAESEG